MIQHSISVPNFDSSYCEYGHSQKLLRLRVDGEDLFYILTMKQMSHDQPLTIKSYLLLNYQLIAWLMWQEVLLFILLMAWVWQKAIQTCILEASIGWLPPVSGI
jgi:hypothetical protein